MPVRTTSPRKGIDMEDLKPRDHAEKVALYRASIIGGLTLRELDRGQLATELESLSKQRFCPPRSHGARCYGVSTLERWYYKYKQGGLDALTPKTRSDKGRGRVLGDELRTLLLGIRDEHPSASVALIRRTLIADGRLDRDALTETTLRRFYKEHGRDRVTVAHEDGRTHVRLRWEAERPGALWHGDVCHAIPILVGGARTPVRVHAFMDDASRRVLDLEAMHAERESDMLGMLVRSLRKYGPPDGLYLDNGATYRGETLRLACERIGITLLHARPYDARSRGKMERFWRTLREGCLSHLGSLASLHDINVRLWSFLDEHYHRAPHAALMGKTPLEVFNAAIPTPDTLHEARLREALTIRARRRVRRDSTLSFDGADWELDQLFLAGRIVDVRYCVATPNEPPWIEHEGERYTLHLVDPKRNARRRRVQVPSRKPKVIPFDPAGALLDRNVGRDARGDR